MQRVPRLHLPSRREKRSAQHVRSRALATGLVTLLTNAQATRVVTDDAGRVTGVEYVANGHRTAASASAVVIAGGAIETARLLLLSDSKHHPGGLGNHSGHLGRHLQSHTYPIALGILPPDVPNPNRDPSVSVATTAHNHGNPGVIGGAMMANDFVKTPVTHWRFALPPDVPRWGLANKRAMRELYLRTVDVRAPVQEIPTPANRVTLHPTHRDPLGQPVANLAGVVHPETRAPPRSSETGSPTGSGPVAPSAVGHYRTTHAASPTGSTSPAHAA